MRFTLNIVISMNLYILKRGRFILAKIIVFRLPDISLVLLEYVPEADSDVILFLKHLCPLNPREFVFNWYASARYKIDYYLDAFEKAVKHMTGDVKLNFWIHSRNSLERVVKASANSTRLIIRFSKIDWDQDFDFKGPVYNIKYFGLPWWGDQSEDGWSSAPDKLRRIIKSISESSMKETLETINVHQWGVSVEKVKDFLKLYELNKVKVVEEENWTD